MARERKWMIVMCAVVTLVLAGCGKSAAQRTYQSLELPADLALFELDAAQQRTFCAWMYAPALQCNPDPAQTVADPVLIQACLNAWTAYPTCTMSQYEACGKATFADPCGATPEACTVIAGCPVFPPVNAGSPPSATCDGVMAPGSLRWCDVDGTAKDMTTGNVWLKNLDCPDDLGIPRKYEWMRVFSLWDSLRWAAALATHNCSLRDGSVAGDWSIPTMDQFVSLTQGVEPVSSATQRVFEGTVPTLEFFWTSQPYTGFPGYWCATSLDLASSGYGRCNAMPLQIEAHHLPVRRTLTVTSVDALTPGRGYSMAPANALNAVAGTSFSTRSYLTFPIWLPAPGRIGLSSWDNATRTPRIFYFEADTANPGFFRIWYTHGSNVRFNLAVEANSVHPGAGVVGWPDAGGDNRLWKAEFVDGGVMLRSRLSGLCMHIETNDGLFLRQDPCDATNLGQVFVLTPRQDG